MARKKPLDYQPKRWEKERLKLEKHLKTMGGVSASEHNLLSIIRRGKQSIFQWENPYAQRRAEIRKKAEDTWTPLERSIVEKAGRIISCDNIYITYICFEGHYQNLAEKKYLLDTSDQACLELVSISGAAGVTAELFRREGAVCGNERPNFEYALMKLIACGNPIPACAAAEPLVRLYRGEPADLAPWAESQEPGHYQNCLRAILSRDEAALNDALEARIRERRKHLYPTFIDICAAACVKIGAQYGLRCGLEAVELPRMFLEAENRPMSLPPFYDEVTALLRERAEGGREM